MRIGPIHRTRGILQGAIDSPILARFIIEDRHAEGHQLFAGKPGGESKGMVSIMTMIKEDLEDEIANGAVRCLVDRVLAHYPLDPFPLLLLLGA